jgi:hypothetical protein
MSLSSPRAFFVLDIVSFSCQHSGANDAWVALMTDFVSQAAPVVMEMKSKLEQMPVGKQHVL